MLQQIIYAFQSHVRKTTKRSSLFPAVFPLSESKLNISETIRRRILLDCDLQLKWIMYTYNLQPTLDISNTRYIELYPNSNKTLGPFSINSSGVTTVNDRLSLRELICQNEF